MNNRVITNPSLVTTLSPEFDVDKTNAIANIKNAEAALKNAEAAQDSVAIMRAQLESTKCENNRMFIIALVSAIAAILAALPELIKTVVGLFC